MQVQGDEAESRSASASTTDWWATASPSNPTVRVVAILEHLTRHPERSFRATEIARDLGITKSTCLAILGTLTDAGYLIQHPTRREYRLGPALITVGRAAQDRFPDVRAGHDLLRRCAAGFRAPIDATTIIDDQIAIIEVVGDADPFGGVLRAGVRVSFRPPYGAVFVAWGDTARWRQWLAAAQPPVDQQQVETLRASIGAARRRRFVVTVPLPRDHELTGLQDRLWMASARRVDPSDLDRLAVVRMSGEVPYLLDEIVPERSYAVGQLQAPVLPPPGRDPLAISVNLWGRTLTGAEIETAGARLIATADELATALR